MNLHLGLPGEAFAFSQCHNKVPVADASGLTGEIAHLEEFIRGICKAVVGFSVQFLCYQWFQLMMLFSTGTGLERVEVVGPDLD